MVSHAECLELFRIEFEEVVFLEAPTPVDADRAGRIHTGTLVECEEILHGNDRHTCI